MATKNKIAYQTGPSEDSKLSLYLWTKLISHKWRGVSSVPFTITLTFDLCCSKRLVYLNAHISVLKNYLELGAIDSANKVHPKRKFTVDELNTAEKWQSVNIDEIWFIFKPRDE